jgi:hydrogenase-4 membrane subunit HyfE
MSPLLMGLLGVMLVPFFVATWRMSLLGLVCQGVLIAWVAYRLNPDLQRIETWITLGDLVLVRGLLAPVGLYRIMTSRKSWAREAVMPPNLLSWTVAFGLVIAAFNLPPSIAPVEGDQRALISVAASGILLAFLALASQPATFGQVVGALRLENAIALFELGDKHQRGLDLVIQLGELAIVTGTLGLYLWLMQGLPETTLTQARQDEEAL